ncbi:hypothetical protein ANCDUO_08466 [Ancylostoma duodenale]|uniref:Uncharacterized protein n=1 Tax=Ancylostoma duodenale TaxID=51022 RepID=A0A0C2GJ79_9BILA|nr:hypothetical protein ANCDUO_08466 [Ancylostoma duodenale]
MTKGRITFRMKSGKAKAGIRVRTGRHLEQHLIQVIRKDFEETHFGTFGIKQNLAFFATWFCKW